MRPLHELKVTAEGDRDLVMTRVFDAPRELVFEAWTRPELLTRWLGVRAGWTLAVCEIDLRVGGTYRWVWRHAERGLDMGMGGVYSEIVRPERLVSTELFDDPWYPGGAVNTMVLVEKRGQTHYTGTTRYVSREVRDEILRGPMASGVRDSFDKLAELLAAQA